MKNNQIIAIVIGSCLLTFICSVIFAMNMVTITPKQLAKVIKKDPAAFFKALEETHKEAQAIRAKEKQEEAKEKMEEQFKNPLKIETKGRVAFGEESAPIVIVEYSSFQCMYCARAAESMAALRKKYDGKVKLVYKHFPLSFQKFSKPAAEYFEAVAMISHDKARDFHDEIFYNFEKYARLNSPEDINKAIKNIVKNIGLGMKTVEENLEKAKKVVKADIEEATKLGVGGTPSFFINGIDAKGGGVEMIIDRLLEEDTEDKDDDK